MTTTDGSMTWKYSGINVWTLIKGDKTLGWVSGYFTEEGVGSVFEVYKENIDSTAYLGWTRNLADAKAMLSLCVKNNTNLENITHDDKDL